MMHPPVVRHIARGVLLLAGVIVAPLAARAQAAPGGAAVAPDTESWARLGLEARAAVGRVLDSARVAALPTAPLRAKVTEGVVKGADDARIVAAVRALAASLATARAALGPGASEAEVTAGAAAVQGGVPAAWLRRWRAAAPAAHPLTTLLVVVGDLAARGVPADQLGPAALRLAASGASDARFTQLRRDVVADLTAGANPAAVLHNQLPHPDAGNDPRRPGGPTP